MIRIVIFIIFSIIISSNSSAQKNTKKELIQIGKSYFTKVEKTYEQNNFDSALVYIDSALFYVQQTEDWESIISYMVAKSSLFNYKGDYLHFDSTLQATYQLASKKLDHESRIFGSILNSLGRRFLDIGDYNNAIQKFEGTLEIEKKIGNKISIASVLNNLGDLYFDKGDYDEALNYYRACKQNRSDTLGIDWRVAKSSIHIGNTFREKNNKEEALKHYNEALEMLNKILLNPKMKNSDNVFKQLTSVNLNLGELALENKKWKEAEAKVKQAKKFSEQVYVYDKGKSIDILGEIKLQQYNYKKAIEYFFKSLDLANDEFSVFEKHSIKAKKTLKIATVYTQIEDWKNALKYFLQTLNLVTHDFEATDFEKNPSIENIYSSLIAIEAMKGKAICFFQFYNKNKNLDDLKIAYQTYQASLELIPALRKSFRQEGSKELLSTKVLS